MSIEIALAISLHAFRLWGFFAGVIIVRDVFHFILNRMDATSEEVQKHLDPRKTEYFKMVVTVLVSCFLGVFLIVSGLGLTYATSVGVSQVAFRILLNTIWAIIAIAGWLQVLRYSPSIDYMSLVSLISLVASLFTAATIVLAS